MTELKKTIFIEADPRSVAEVATDPGLYLEWYAGCRSFEASGNYPDPGSTAKMTMTLLKKGFNVDVTIADHDFGVFMVMEFTGDFEGSTRFDLVDDDGGTSFTWTLNYEVPGGTLGQIADKILIKNTQASNMESSLEALKNLVENS